MLLKSGFLVPKLIIVFLFGGSSLYLLVNYGLYFLGIDKSNYVVTHIIERADYFFFGLTVAKDALVVLASILLIKNSRITADLFLVIFVLSFIWLTVTTDMISTVGLFPFFIASIGTLGIWGLISVYVSKLDRVQKFA